MQMDNLPLSSDSPVSPPSILWVGGSSALTRTFLNKFYGDNFVLAGLEPNLPNWAHPMMPYLQMDLTKQVIVPENILNIIQIMIIGVRGDLASGKDQEHERLLVGIQSLLKQFQGKFVLHISSVAAVDHLRAQVCQNEDHQIPPLSEYKGSYDRFKRRSEDLITQICSQRNIGYTHLRLGAIFSESYECIQCSALALQSRIGSRLPTRIDCNSSRNVAQAIRLILERINVGELEQDPPTNKTPNIQPLYYYTRPTIEIIPYGDYLKEFRAAYSMKIFIPIPPSVVMAFFWLFHWLLSNFSPKSIDPIFHSIDYLLQVASREHTFDNTRFRTDFPEINKIEESIAECFIRRKRTIRKIPDLSDLYAASS